MSIPIAPAAAAADAWQMRLDNARQSFWEQDKTTTRLSCYISADDQQWWQCWTTSIFHAQNGTD